MKLIIAGCEYTGTTSLASAVCDWASDVLGGHFAYHDHWKLPHIACYPGNSNPEPLNAADQAQILGLSRKLKEQIQRHNLNFHMPTDDIEDFVLVGYHLDDDVLGPLYFGYGREDEIQGGLRTKYARHLEQRILETAPDSILVLPKASPEIISARMNKAPHQNSPLKEQDIEHVLERFEYEYEWSLLSNKITIDTSVRTTAETLEEFIRLYKPMMTASDRIRTLARQTAQSTTGAA